MVEEIHPTHCYIYFLSSSLDPNNVRYIGKAKRLKYRLQKHMDSHRHKVRMDYKTSWIKSVLKNGGEILITELDFIPNEDWRFWEMHYISLYKSWGFKLTNSDHGGYGSDLTKETIEKMRVARIGQKRSPEQRARMSLAQKGKKLSLEAIQRRIGKKRSLEVRQKISKNHPKLNSKKVKMFDLKTKTFISEFSSMSAGLKHIGRKESVKVIRECCNKMNKFAYGYYWEWA